jgi:hypothetical protein
MSYGANIPDIPAQLWADLRWPREFGRAMPRRSLPLREGHPSIVRKSFPGANEGARRLDRQ